MQNILTLNLPGIPSSDIEVTSTSHLNGNHLLKVKVRSKYETLSDTWVVSSKYDIDKLQAKLDLGVLTVEAPLKQGPEPRRHEVKAPNNPIPLQQSCNKP